MHTTLDSMKMALLLSVAGGAIITTPAHAQTQNATVASAQNPIELEEVVVTGTSRERRRLDAAYAISTASEAQIQKLAPLSSVDLVQKLPGFGAEPSGGETGNNVNTRGLPASNFRFVALVEDGLPVFQEAQESFINADELVRLDASIERVEAVRGGTSPIYTSNAPGGTINFINKVGSETPSGVLRFTVGDWNHYRLDANSGGKLAERLYFNVGGFYRIDDGQRPVGFRANQGGQIRLGLTREFEDGGVLTVYGKYLDDKTVFYLPIPLADPRDPSRSLANLIDPNTGTLTSNDFRFVSIRTLNGTAGGTRVNEDLADGVHSKVKMVGANYDKTFESGWSIANKLRYTDGSVGFNALFSTTAPVGADTFAAGQLARAQAGFGSTVTGLRYVLANSRNADGSRIAFDPATTGGLVTQAGWWVADTQFTNVMDDLRVSRTFGEGAGRHDVTAGGAYSQYTFSQNRLQSSILLNVKSQPQALDLLAVNAAGATVGSVTENGFVNYVNNGDLGGSVDGTVFALYVTDDWHITDRLTLDAGYRKQWTDQSGFALVRTTQNLGDATTLADDSVGGPTGARLYRSEKFDAVAWTLGANFDVSDHLGVFGRYGKSFRTPALANIFTGSTQAPVIITKIKQAEAGAKWSSPGLQLYATAFWNKFDPLTESVSLPNSAGGFTNINFTSTTETRGVELEAVVRPVDWFDVAGNVTLQDPQLKGLINRATGAVIPGVEGNQIRRFPKVLATVTPTLHLKMAGRTVDLYSTVYHQGNRFVDTANSTRLPAFTTVDAGILVGVTERLQLQVVGSNLTNEVGLTEGNGRVDQISGQGTPVAIYARPIFGRSFRASLTYRW